MALTAGLNITASDMKNLLMENESTQNSIRAWRSLFDEASQRYQSGIADANRAFTEGIRGATTDYAVGQSRLARDYSDAIRQAYASNQAQRNSIVGTGLAAGSAGKLLSMSQEDLHAAYANYLSKFASDRQTMSDNLDSTKRALATQYNSDVTAAASDYEAATKEYTKGLTDLDTALNEKATNLASLYSKAYDYAKYLSELTPADALLTSAGQEFKKSLSSTDSLDQILENAAAMQSKLRAIPVDWYDDTGVIKTLDDLGIVDANGNLTEQGRQFFDATFNAMPYGKFVDTTGESAQSFDEWLSANDPKLRDWAAQNDMMNASSFSTNFSTAKDIVGVGNLYQKFNYTKPEDIDKLASNDTVKRIGTTFTELSNRLSTAKTELDKLDDIKKRLDDDALYSRSRGQLGEPYHGLTSVREAERSKYLTAKKAYDDATKEYNTFVKDTQDKLDNFTENLRNSLQSMLGSSNYQSLETEFNTYISAADAFKKDVDKYTDFANAYDALIKKAQSLVTK